MHHIGQRIATTGDGRVLVVPRALSVKQPRAEVTLSGIESVERGPLPTRIRGRVHVHASLLGSGILDRQTSS